MTSTGNCGALVVSEVIWNSAAAFACGISNSTASKLLVATIASPASAVGSTVSSAAIAAATVHRRAARKLHRR